MCEPGTENGQTSYGTPRVHVLEKHVTSACFHGGGPPDLWKLWMYPIGLRQWHVEVMLNAYFAHTSRDVRNNLGYNPAWELLWTVIYKLRCRRLA